MAGTPMAQVVRVARVASLLAAIQGRLLSPRKRHRVVLRSRLPVAVPLAVWCRAAMAVTAVTVRQVRAAMAAMAAPAARRAASMAEPTTALVPAERAARAATQMA